MQNPKDTNPRHSQDDFRKEDYGGYHQRFERESYHSRGRHSYHRGDSQRRITENNPISHREKVSRELGIPADFIKSDAATKPGITYQPKPSEIRYHFYIICMDCRDLHVTKVKDLIIREIEELGYKLNKEYVYVDDKDLEPEYKALVGFKFDHIALK